MKRVSIAIAILLSFSVSAQNRFNSVNYSDDIQNPFIDGRMPQMYRFGANVDLVTPYPRIGTIQRQTTTQLQTYLRWWELEGGSPPKYIADETLRYFFPNGCFPCYLPSYMIPYAPQVIPRSPEKQKALQNYLLGVRPDLEL